MQKKRQHKVTTILSDSDELIMKTRSKRFINDEIIVEISINDMIQDEYAPRRKRKVMYDEDEEVMEVRPQQQMESSVKKPQMKLKKKCDIVITSAQENIETCPICFNDLHKLQAVCLPCQHFFCYKCIKTQAEKYQNNCPLCRVYFKQYTMCIRGQDGEYLRGENVRIKKKAARYQSEQSDGSVIIVEQVDNTYAQNESYDAEDSFIVQDNECCEFCGCNEDLEQMLFCRECSKIVCHTYCNTQQTRSLKCISCRGR